MTDTDRSFAVVVHDAAPGYKRPLEAIRRALEPRVGSRASAAVVPCWGGQPLETMPSVTSFARMIADGFDEILQHGCTHRQERPGLVSWLTEGSNELSGLPAPEVRSRLERGRLVLQRVFARRILGFVPPAWIWGRASLDELSRCGFAYAVGLWALRGMDSQAVPLATWSWDWGRLPRTGRVGAGLGHLVGLVRPRALPCVVIHPADLDRGYLPRSLLRIDRLMAGGRKPVLLADVVSALSDGRDAS